MFPAQRDVPAALGARSPETGAEIVPVPGRERQDPVGALGLAVPPPSSAALLETLQAGRSSGRPRGAPSSLQAHPTPGGCFQQSGGPRCQAPPLKASLLPAPSPAPSTRAGSAGVGLLADCTFPGSGSRSHRAFPVPRPGHLPRQMSLPCPRRRGAGVTEHLLTWVALRVLTSSPLPVYTLC